MGLSLRSVRGGLTGTGPDALKLADQLSSSWAAFTATGDPNNAELPDWEAYDSEKRATMIFSEDCHLEYDPRAEIREFWDSVMN